MFQIIFHVDYLIYIEFLFKLSSHLVNLLFQNFHSLIADLVLYIKARKTFPFFLHSIQFAFNLIYTFLKLRFDIIIVLKNFYNELIIFLNLNNWLIFLKILDIKIVDLWMLHRLLLIAIQFYIAYIFLFVIAEKLVGLNHSLWVSLKMMARFWVLRG